VRWGGHLAQAPRMHCMPPAEYDGHVRWREVPPAPLAQSSLPTALSAAPTWTLAIGSVRSLALSSRLQGSTGLAGVSTRPAGLLHPLGATSCHKAAPLTYLAGRGQTLDRRRAAAWAAAERRGHGSMREQVGTS